MFHYSFRNINCKPSMASYYARHWEYSSEQKSWRHGQPIFHLQLSAASASSHRGKQQQTKSLMWVRKGFLEPEG